MSSVAGPPRPVEAWPCQSICVWAATGEVWTDAATGPVPVFGCAGCGSEWVRTEAWTPVDASGRVPPEVRAERVRDGFASGVAGSADRRSSTGS